MFRNNPSTTCNSLRAQFCQTKSHMIAFIMLCLLSIGFLTTTIVFGVLWNRSKATATYQYAAAKGTIGFPIRLPDDGKYVQWTFLQMNDVYEMLPLDEGRKGGLARVARARQLLLEENAHTYTIMAGDFLSPSALNQAKVNGTPINGQQMIATMDELGVDFAILGNHEFDLSEKDLLARMGESKFTWIASNVFKNGSNEPFSSTIRYKILSVDEIHLLLIGLTINIDKPYIRIINQTSLVAFVQDFLKSIADIKYDVLVAITHLDLQTDIKLAENIPEIDLIIGGHEHEDYFLSRGFQYIPITKADPNAFTVFIHRCAFNVDTKRFLVYQTFAKITPELEDEPKTAAISKYWYDLGMKSFESMGFEPNKVVSCLPATIQLDGRSTSVRNFPTLLTDLACQSFLTYTAMNGTKIGVFNSGSIRIDDFLRGTITQYDALRVFPFQDKLYSLSAPGLYLAKVLTKGMLMKGSGEFLGYCGIDTPDGGKSWLINGTDISTSGQNYSIATIRYLKDTQFIDPLVTIWKEFNMTQTQALINYLQNKYPPC